MTPEDFQAELDKEKADRKDQDDKQATIGAINKAGIKNVQATNAAADKTTDALRDGGAKVAVTNPDLAKSSDLAATTDAINKMNLTAFMTNDGLPKLAQGLVDFTDQIKNLSDQYKDKGFEQLAQKLDDTVNTLKTVSKNLGDTKIKVDVPLKKTLDSLNSNIKSIDFKPTVNVAAPNVNVPKLDTSGMERILTDFTSSQDTDKVELDDYYAQDLDELEQGVQYVGFLNESGHWYIIKNIEADNKLRYAFGNDSYADFWPIASKLDYKRLDEALHATQT